MPFLHGVEVIEVSSGARSVSVPATAVIGIVGTAQYLDAAEFPLDTPVLIAGSTKEAARLLSTLPAAIADVVPHRVGTLPTSLHQIFQQAATPVVVVRVATVETAALPAVATSAAEPFVLVDGQTLEVSVDGGAAQTVAINTGDFGDIGAATAVEVASVILAAVSGVTVDVFEADKVRLTTISTGGDSDLGFAGDPNDELELAAAAGTAPALDHALTAANIVGGVDVGSGAYTGISALVGAKSVLGMQPRILIAPDFTGIDTVRDALLAAAGKLRAVALLAGPNTTDADAIAAAGAKDDRRGYMVDPGTTSDVVGILGAPMLVNTDATAFVAGTIARNDAENGWWSSPSNTPISGIAYLKRPVDFSLGDPTSRANLLNAGNVATIINEAGQRLWGNRTMSTDPRWAFLPNVRAADVIYDALLAAHLWAVDRSVTKTYLGDVVEGVNAFLSKLVRLGALAGGKCWADPEVNTPDVLATGQVYFDFDFTITPTAERVTFRANPTTDYLTELF